MGRVILLCGKDAQTPYRFVNPDVLVYSLEELCFVLKGNAFLLDAESLDKRLVTWIAMECGLKDLASSLTQHLGKRGSAEGFVLTILEYSGLYDRETLQEVETLLQQSSKMNVYEKLKTRVDQMVAGGRYVAALTEYDKLLSRLPKEEQELRSGILHNTGVALAGLFLFEQAAKYFKMSYEISGEEETHQEYLAAMRMQLGETDYISFVAERPQSHQLSLELERRIEQFSILWEESLHRKRLGKLQEWKENGEMTEYYHEVEKMIEGMKHSYQINAGE